MATAPGNSDTAIKLMEDHLSCSICFNLLREPKDLDCPHVFCLPCLQKWVKGGKIVECPECRHRTALPEGGLVALKTNLRLKNMVEEYAKVLECERPQQHDVKELKADNEELKAEVTRKLEQLQEEIERSEGEKREMEDAKRNMEAAKTKAVKDIDTQTKSIITSVYEKRKEMIECVERTYIGQNRILSVKQKQATDRIRRLQSVQTATRNVVDTAADRVNMKQYASLVMEMDELCTTETDAVLQDVGSLCFNPGTDLMNCSWFGDVTMHGRKIQGLKLVNEFGAFQQATGVAVDKTGLLAIVDCKAEEVITYRDVDGEYKLQFRLGSSAAADRHGEITRPFQVAVTSEGRFLVTHSGRIAKIFSSSSSGRYEKTLTDVGGKITTAPDGLIVTGHGATGAITVHQSGGELIRKHQVDCERRILGIASNGKQIAYTSFNADNPKNSQVCAIDFVTGRVLWTVDMVAPFAICYEQKSNTLLVAGGARGHGDCVIDQLCSTTGCLISHLASHLYTPYAMTVTHDSKLVVADCKTVKVYELY